MVAWCTRWIPPPDSILLAHELCHNLHTGNGRARMCLKLDLRKAFDSLNRQFLCSALKCFGLHENWIGWIQECMNPTFSLLINGECTARFDSSTGIRQGDPLSPYLFVIAMQVLSALLKKAESNHELDPFSCGPLSVSHVIFADDPMIFLHVDKKNACHLKHLLDDFTALSKLRININKSAIYFGGPVKHCQWIVSHLGLNQEELLVRYLGLPLLSKRLSQLVYNLGKLSSSPMQGG